IMSCLGLKWPRKGAQSCSEPLSWLLISHLDRGGIGFRQKLGAPSIAEGAQIIDPAWMLPSELNRVEFADQPEEIISVVREPSDWDIARDHRLHRMVPENDKWFQSSNCVTNGATPCKIVDMTWKRQAHKIYPL